MPSPLFLFSLPRSGSTLLQRILSSHPDIASAAEPWLLLPMLYAVREKGVFAEYSHWQLHSALLDFFKELPEGRADYLRAVNKAASFLYAQATPGQERYFLDKTPRYALIAGEVLETFPEAKAIFLWRHPLAIAASMAETWGSGKWSLFRYQVDLYAGMEQLIESYQMNAERVLAVNYESLLRQPEQELARISAYLEITLGSDVLRTFSGMTFSGTKGDPIGTKLYSGIATEPMKKWKTVICNPLRKRWATRYLHWLGEERLKVMGYSLQEMLDELKETRVGTRWLLSDIGQLVYGFGVRALELSLLRRKYKITANLRELKLHD